MMVLLPKRRWLRFSVRTLLIAVTIFCVWLGWQVSIVREREALKQWALDHGGIVTGADHPFSIDALYRVMRMPNGTVPWYRKMLGDSDVKEIVVPEVWREEQQVKDIDAYFPEAKLHISG